MISTAQSGLWLTISVLGAGVRETNTSVVQPNIFGIRFALQGEAGLHKEGNDWERRGLLKTSIIFIRDMLRLR